MASKVLIIKTGFSETFDPRVSDMVSLGDVFCCTMILHAFKDSHVTWLTHSRNDIPITQSAFPLLEGNPYIDRILPYDLTSILQLKSETFDTVINLEKVPGLCALADSIAAIFVRYGFTLDQRSGAAKTHHASSVLDPYMLIGTRKEDRRFWPEVLFEAISRKWNGERSILGWKTQSKVTYDIGLNYNVGSKWPNKAWPKTNFALLDSRLRDLGYTVSWQKGKNDVTVYADWINSCGLIVTNDSLGLHLAVAMEKKIVGLFGPTFMHPKYLDGLGTIILSQEHNACLFCWESKCSRTVPHCMEGISVDRVLEEVRRLL